MQHAFACTTTFFAVELHSPTPARLATGSVTPHMAIPVQTFLGEHVMHPLPDHAKLQYSQSTSIFRVRGHTVTRCIQMFRNGRTKVATLETQVRTLHLRQKIRLSNRSHDNAGMNTPIAVAVIAAYLVVTEVVTYRQCVHESAFQFHYLKARTLSWRQVSTEGHNDVQVTHAEFTRQRTVTFKQLMPRHTVLHLCTFVRI